MRKPGFRIACLCLALCLGAGAALAEQAWVETGKGALNVRKKKSSKSTIVIKVPNGSEVELLEADGDWSRIQYKGKTGYVKSDFISDEPREEVKEEVIELAILQTGGHARISTQSGSLNIRRKADSKSSVVGQVPNGARVEVGEANEQWSSIIHEGKKGYVRTEYLVLDSQLLGKEIYPDGAYLHVRSEPDASSESLLAVSASQPVTVLSIDGDWIRAFCQDPLSGDVLGYVSLDDVSQWRETPAPDAKPPVYAKLDVSAQQILLGEELDIHIACADTAQLRLRIACDGRTVLKEQALTSTAFSYRPRKAGTYQLEVIVSEPGGGTIGCERRFTVDAQAVPQADEGFTLYSQKDGWWLDKKYSRSNLDQSGCAIFTLAHALDLLGMKADNTRPEVLAKDYAAYLAESGTVTSNLLAAAGRNFGFTTSKDKIHNAAEIAQHFDRGAVFSFAIVNGHIALAAGMSEDGTKVRVIDSAPSATMERIVGACMYLPDEAGQWKSIQSLWDMPGAKYYAETGQFSGMEYYLDLSYVASRGVRLIAPK